MSGAHYCIEDLEVGMEAAHERVVTGSDIETFAELSGDNNPVHLDAEFAAKSPFKARIAHGMLTASFISTILGTKLPGHGCIYLSQTLRFKAPVRLIATDANTSGAKNTPISASPSRAKKRSSIGFGTYAFEGAAYRAAYAGTRILRQSITNPGHR